MVEPVPDFCTFRGRVVLGMWVVFLLVPMLVFAGGGPFNTLVVVNTNSADSIELGEYYAAAHGIPDHHICRLGLATNLHLVTSNEFRSLLRDPIRSHLVAEGLDGQIDYLVLCQTFPTRVAGIEGVSPALFYGYKNAPAFAGICTKPDNTSNAYFRAERAFRYADGWNATNGFIAFHLLAADLATAKLVADRGAAAQSSFPPSSVYLHLNGDAFRGVREQLFGNAQFSFAALPGLPASCIIGPYPSNLSGQTNVIGYHDGYVIIPGVVRTNNTWLPGAYADHMTSLGGVIPPVGHSTVLDWMSIGATASYGTVTEPCNYLAKFPDPLLGFFYARGFTLGESYAMAVENPYQGLFAGDPLAAPFAAPPEISVLSHTPFHVVSGTVSLHVIATAHSMGVPAATLDLYLDGRYQTNLAAIAPTRFNQLSVTVGQQTYAATAAANDTLYDAVASLAAKVNSDPGRVVHAIARGDRLELMYMNFDRTGDYLPVAASVERGSASALTLGVGRAAPYLVPSENPAREFVELTGTANDNDILTCVLTLTNGIVVSNRIVATQGESGASILERLRSAINGDPVLQGPEGIRYDRLAGSPNTFGALIARAPGTDGWNLKVDYFVNPASPGSGLSTNGNFSSLHFDDNPRDILPRASVLFHVTPTNGILTATASLDTSVLPDGIHQLDFIARDGSAVAAQARHALPLVVANTSCVLTVISALGTPTPPAGIYLLPPGSVLTNSVAAPTPSGGTRFTCTGWNLIGNEPISGMATNFTMSLTNHAILEWIWTTNYWLDTEADPHGAVNVGDSWQPAHETVWITAIPATYYHFTNWTGALSSAENPLGLLMDAAKRVQANFAPSRAPRGTPEWWLARFGWTNDFDVAELHDEPDDFPAWQEYIADTDPKDSTSYPRVASITVTDAAPVITWPASPERHYQIHWSDDLVLGIWVTQQLFLGTDAWIDTNLPPVANRYYRIAPQLP